MTFSKSIAGLTRASVPVVLFTHMACQHAFAQFSAETQPEFNRFAGGNGTVNQFTGTVALPQPLVTLKGKGDLNVNVTLNYSSNVYVNVLARNDIAPTGWVGLGWSLQLGGTISSDHNSTMTLGDDKFTYLSPEGVSQRILQENGKYFLEKNPYWKVTPHVQAGAETERIIAWTLIDPNGTVFKYGDSVSHAQAGIIRNATRYVFAWESSKHVGTGFADGVLLYPIQWDLREKEDLGRNKVRFTYQQERESIKYKTTWTSPVQFTKASYLTKIEMPDGQYVEIELRDKAAKEYLDPKRFLDEPDNFMEFYETKYVDRIRIKNKIHETMREFALCYKIINDDPAMEEKGNYYKRLLTKVIERGTDLKDVGTTEYAYYDEWQNRASEKNPTPKDYNFGALKQVKGTNCGVTSYEYRRQDFAVQKRSDLPGSETFGSNYKVAGGTLEDGTEYVVVANSIGRKGTQLWLYNWESGQWRAKTILYKFEGRDYVLEPGVNWTIVQKQDGTFMMKYPEVELFAGKNYFIVLQKGSTIYNDYADAIRWDGKKWATTNFSNYVPDGNGFQLSDDFFVRYPVGAISAGPARFWVYNWVHDAWTDQEIHPRDGEDPLGSASQFILFRANKNNIVSLLHSDFLPGYDGEFQTWHWNGHVWENQVIAADAIDQHTDFVLGEDYLFEAEQDGVNAAGILVSKSHEARAWNWDGRAWRYTLDRERLDLFKTTWFGEAPVDVTVHGDGWAGIRHEDGDELRLYQWSGDEWLNQYDRNMVNIDVDFRREMTWRGASGNDFFAVTTPGKRRATISIPWLRCDGWFDCDWTTKEIVTFKFDKNDLRLKAFNWSGEDWGITDFGYNGNNDIAKSPKLGNNFIVEPSRPHDSWVWNGQAWIKDIREKSLSDNITIISPNVFAEKSGNRLTLHRKFQNSLANEIFAYVVSTVTFTDPIVGTSSAFHYAFAPERSLFDTRTGSPKFNLATESFPGYGQKKTYFYNNFLTAADQELKTLNANFELLDGQVYKTETYANNGKLSSRSTYKHEIFTGDLGGGNDRGWPEAVYDIQTVEAVSTSEGISKKTLFEYGNSLESNGLYAKQTTENSDGTKVVTQRDFAYQYNDVYPDMTAANHNQLNQVASTRTLQVAAGGTSRIVRSTVNLWGTFGPEDAKTKRLLGRTLAWTAKDPETQEFHPYDYRNATAEQGPWRTLDILDYNKQAQSISNMDRAGVVGSKIWGRGGSRIIAEAIGTLPAYVSVFTGDYEHDGTYYDFENGWKKGGSELDANLSHFGKKSVRVTAGDLGPNDTVAYDQTAERDYVFSAWVYPVLVNGGNAVILGVRNPGATEQDPGQDIGDGRVTGLQPGSTHGWQYISRTVSHDDVTGGKLAIRVASENSAEFFVDDIRFYPKGSLVSTHYFDDKLGLNIASVAPENIAQFVSYDPAGRPLASFAQNKDLVKIKLKEWDYGKAQACREGPGGSGALAWLKLSEGVLEFDPVVRSYNAVFVQNGVERVRISLATSNPSETAVLSVDGGQAITACCSGEATFDVDLKEGFTDVAIVVGTGDPYNIRITRKTNCWTFSGTAPAGERSSMPSLEAIASVPHVAYIRESDGMLRVRKQNGAAWIDVGGVVSDDKARDPILRYFNGVPHVAYLERGKETVTNLGGNSHDLSIWVGKAKKLVSGVWQPIGGVQTASVDGRFSKGEASHLNFEINQVTGELWVAFEGDSRQEKVGAEPVSNVWYKRAYAKKLSGNLWVPAGDYMVPAPAPSQGAPMLRDKVPDGIISNSPVQSLSMALGSDGYPIVAYVGSPEYQPEPAPGEQSVSALIVRKLMREAVNPPDPVTGEVEFFFWSGVQPQTGTSDFNAGGDIIEVPLPLNARLRTVGSQIYLAYSYLYLNPVEGAGSDLVDGNEAVLEVRKFDPASTGLDGSHWLRLPEGADETASRLLILAESDEYSLDVVSGSPMLAYRNGRSANRVTVIKYNASASKWQSVGNPEFMEGAESTMGSQLDLSSIPGGAHHLAIRGAGGLSESRRNRINALYYNTSCPDVTMGSLAVKRTGKPDVALNLDFKQYFTQYSGTIDHGDQSVQVQVVPNNCSDIATVWARVNGGDYVKSPTPLNCNSISLNLALAPGVENHLIEVVGRDAANSNVVQYKVNLFRKANPQPVSLALEFTDPQGLPLSSMPAFRYDLQVPYRLQDVPENVQYIEVKPAFAENMKAFVNGESVGNGIRRRVAITSGVNTILVSTVFQTGERHEYTFALYRLKKDEGGQSNLSGLVRFTNPVDESPIVPIPLGNKTYQLNISNDISLITGTVAIGNACPTYIDGVEIGVGIDHTFEPADGMQLIIHAACPGQVVETQVVQIKVSGSPDRAYVVGRPESGEPAGFYDFPDLIEMYARVQEYVASIPDDQSPSKLTVYQIMDRERDYVLPPAGFLASIEGQTKTVDYEVIGVTKGSPKYQQLRQDYDLGNPHP